MPDRRALTDRWKFGAPEELTEALKAASWAAQLAMEITQIPACEIRPSWSKGKIEVRLPIMRPFWPTDFERLTKLADVDLECVMFTNSDEPHIEVRPK